MTVNVAIPYYKNRRQLDNCMLHLQKQSVPVQVFIHDNTENNIYFTRAINVALRTYLETCPFEQYYIILNQDMYLEPKAIEEMCLFMDEHPQCGIGMPLQLSHTDPDKVIFGGGVQVFPVGTCAQGTISDYKDNCQIRWADGGCMILRTRMIREIGLFDENMQFVCSDADYSFTAWARGWQVWNIVNARGVHERGCAAEMHVSTELSILKARDIDFFVRKWITGELYRKLNHPSVPSKMEVIKPEIDKIRINLNKLERMKNGMDA
jgi:GT2 family glycosyltransferase